MRCFASAGASACGMSTSNFGIRVSYHGCTAFVVDMGTLKGFPNPPGARSARRSRAPLGWRSRAPLGFPELRRGFGRGDAGGRRAVEHEAGHLHLVHGQADDRAVALQERLALEQVVDAQAVA